MGRRSRRAVSSTTGRNPVVTTPGRERILLVDRVSNQREATLPEPRSDWLAETTHSGCWKTEVLKRSFDIVLSLLLGISILPLAVIISIAIRAESPGPIFYRAVRVGKNGRIFGCLKFRSMYRDADVMLMRLLEKDPRIRAEYECHHKLQCDPRITAVGRLLRRFSLDELPQLWNVLKGDMSIVGPRPLQRGRDPRAG
jgi:lipopolysaccharide/colanic/teichoic acid biosynthesis glycosyltransferase